MSKPHQFDFGFESRTTSFENARVVLLFAASGCETDFGRVGGPLAVADASRYAEFYEMDGDFAPFDIGVCSEIVGGKDPHLNAVTRGGEAIGQNKIPIMVFPNKETIERLDRRAYLSVDIDELNSGTSWYEFIDKLELAIVGRGVASVELVGFDSVEPKSPEALLGAQIIIKIVGFICKAGE